MSDVLWIVTTSMWLGIFAWFSHELWPWILVLIPLAVTIHVLRRKLEARAAA